MRAGRYEMVSRVMVGLVSDLCRNERRLDPEQNYHAFTDHSQHVLLSGKLQNDVSVSKFCDYGGG
jgi:hypothetical protein